MQPGVDHQDNYKHTYTCTYIEHQDNCKHTHTSLCIMKTSLLSVLALSVLSTAAPSEVQDRHVNDLEDRQLVEGIEILIGGIIGGASGALKSWLGPDTP